MTDENSADYYRMREQQERRIAAAAISPAIAAIHLDMANRYLALSDAVLANPVQRRQPAVDAPRRMLRLAVGG